jgi:chromate transporter
VSKSKLQFLKDVLIFTFVAFGGPQAHIAMMLKDFVQKKKYVTEEELVEYNALCQMLPGPSSTQTLVAIAYKFGGLQLAIISFLIWIFPSAIIMSLFAVFYSYYHFSGDILILIKPIAIGFVAYSAYILTSKVLSTRISYILAVLAAVITYIFQNAYVFPVTLVIGIVGAMIFNKENKGKETESLKFNWKKLIPFFGILVLFALLGAIINRTSFFSLPVRLFENFYRNGIMIFGGGQVLVPLLYTEFVEMKQYLTAQEFFAGFALQQAIPGPVFSFTSFVGGVSMKGEGVVGQLLGSFAALMGINIPGLLFILTIFPVWENLKRRKLIQRALFGINSISVGFVIAAFFIMIQPVGFNWISLTAIIITFLLLCFTKVPPYVIVALGLLLGFFL